METEGHTVKKTINRYRSFRYALILEGIVIGAISGAVVVLFRYLLSYADKILNSVLDYGKDHIWFIPVWFIFLAAAAFAVALLLKWEAFISGSGIPQVEGEMIGELDPCWWKVLAAKLGGGLLSLGCGLSLGREGPSIQLGSMSSTVVVRSPGSSIIKLVSLSSCFSISKKFRESSVLTGLIVIVWPPVYVLPVHSII